MLGLQQASFAGGPGKRSDPLLMLRLPLLKVQYKYSSITICTIEVARGEHRYTLTCSIAILK